VLSGCGLKHVAAKRARLKKVLEDERPLPPLLEELENNVTKHRKYARFATPYVS
jgi:hypothetical protein